MTTARDTHQLIGNSANLATTYLGARESRLGVEENVGIPDDARNTHVLSIGGTGTGKTQAAVHAALQDIHKGRGVCFVNPKGDAIDQILGKMPEDRMDDVVYINPAERPVTAVNPLEPHVTDGMSDAALENQKEIIVGDMLALFKRQSQSWGDQWPRILSTLLRAHLELNIQYDEEYTLADVLRCVTDTDALTELVDRVDDPVIRSHLVDIRDNVSDHATLPLKRRIQDFMGNDVIRRVIDADTGQSIDFYDAVNNGKIILVDVQRGEIGRYASPLIGSIVLTQVWAAAQARIALPEQERDLFAVYVDEVKHYASESSNFDEILSESREYGLAVWMISQYLDQLDPAMQQAAVNNCRTKLVFQPEVADDGTRVAQMLVGTGKDQLQRIDAYQAFLQLPGGNEATVFNTFPPYRAVRDEDQVDRVKQEATAASDHAEQEAAVDRLLKLGPGGNAGNQRHTDLLQKAKQFLEQKSYVAQVNLLHQDVGADRPDGEIIKDDGRVANLEAEVSTVSKPGKVLRNVARAARQDRKIIIVTEAGAAPMIDNLLTDPVRDDDEYYVVDGDPFTDTDAVGDAETRLLVHTENGKIMDYRSSAAADCPELDPPDSTEDELVQFCLYRSDDGFCDALEQPCVLTQP